MQAEARGFRFYFWGPQFYVAIRNGGMPTPLMERIMHKTELNYGDVYLVPKKTIVDSRKECDTSVQFGPRRFDMPRLCCTNQQQDELPQSPDGLIPCAPFAACPVL